MELENLYPFAARATVTEYGEHLLCTVMAKLTYRYDGSAQVMDVEGALPLFDKDEETPLGLLPRDDLPRCTEDFAVIILGNAHSRVPVPSMRVAASVGQVLRELQVFGDREWTGWPISGVSSPVPFTIMPLTWERAYGGTTDVLVDKEAIVPLGYQLNRKGRGYDVTEMARSLGQQLSCPDGYPDWDGVHSLPNVESPNALIRNPSDEPEPAGWGCLPLDMPLHFFRNHEASLKDGEQQSQMLQSDPDAEVSIPNDAMLRAHPDWMIAQPPPATPVVLDGLSPNGTQRFQLPMSKLFIDYELGETRGSQELLAHTLVVLADEQRFALSYRCEFLFNPGPAAARSLRIRLE